jgi:hypothetical protein
MSPSWAGLSRLPSGRVGIDNHLGLSPLPLFAQPPVSSKSTAGFHDVESERWRVDFATRHCFREAVLRLHAPLAFRSARRKRHGVERSSRMDVVETCRPLQPPATVTARRRPVALVSPRPPVLPPSLVHLDGQQGDPTRLLGPSDCAATVQANRPPRAWRWRARSQVPSPTRPT